MTEPSAQSTWSERFALVGSWAVLASLFCGAAGMAFLATTRVAVKSVSGAVLENLVGRSVAQAAVWLTSHDLRVELDHFEDSDSAPRHTVVFTSPAPGTELKRGATVKLTVSRGWRRLPLPALSGVAISQATSILARNELSVGRVIEVSDPVVPAGLVLATVPSGGADITPGGVVDVLVSRGAGQGRFVMPDVVGLTFSGIAQSLASIGVASKRVATVQDAASTPGTVLEQFPAAGGVLVSGQSVELTVTASDAGDAETLNPDGTRSIHIAMPVPAGPAAKEVVVQVRRGDATRTVLRRAYRPGTDFEANANVMAGDSVIVTMDGEEVFNRRY